MTALAFKLAGGIGLFLMGMVLLTDGLKAFAGEALRRALVRFTGTPAKAFASGALVTAMVQSSSATTVTVIGFVSAGLLTFPQAIGVVLGASLGTTGTGWIIAALGLKVSVGFYALPLVGAGAFLKLLGLGRWRPLGEALAGFGLIFVGIETLQDGMAGLSGVFNLARLPGGFWGHLLATVSGLVMTVLMQSSSAAVATTLTALHANAINFEQAASLVIGAAVGTTVTGVLAAIGGNVPARRTALAHVTFNLATGIIALAFLPAFLWLIALAQRAAGLEPGAMSLAAFHTSFIALGVAIFLPFVHHFARLIERMLPDRGPALTRHLDQTVLQAPEVALEAACRALSATAAKSFDAMLAELDRPYADGDEAQRSLLRDALVHIEQFLTRVPPIHESGPALQLRLAQVHAMDHLTRFQGRLVLPVGVRRALDHARLEPVRARVRAILEQGAAILRGEARADSLIRLENQAAELAELCRRERPAILEQTANGEAAPAEALELLDAMRWLDRLGYHTWRICHYLGAGDVAARPPAGE